MCISRPSAPRVVYQGPSQTEVDAQNEQLRVFMEQSAAQQAQFATALQQQIDAANQQAEQQRLAMDMELQAMAASSAAQMQGSYMATAAEVAPDPGLSQTTEPIRPVKRPPSSLSITPGTVSEGQGTGLNIGI